MVIVLEAGGSLDGVGHGKKYKEEFSNVVMTIRHRIRVLRPEWVVIILEAIAQPWENRR